MPDVTVPDMTVVTAVSSVGVNTLHTLSVADLRVLTEVTEPSLYVQTPTADKADIAVVRIPVQEGYQVTPVADFSAVRHDGGMRWAREHRQHSQPMWHVKAKFVFASEGEYEYIVPVLLSGVPFETLLVINTTHGIDESYPGVPYRCWPIPSSLTLVGVTHAGYEITLEFMATEV